MGRATRVSKASCDAHIGRPVTAYIAILRLSTTVVEIYEVPTPGVKRSAKR
jgi:hypothetical protein